MRHSSDMRASHAATVGLRHLLLAGGALWLANLGLAGGRRR